MLSNEILLLKIINSNANISVLRNRGLSYSQIAMLIKSLEKDGKIVLTESNISLTKLGLITLDESMSKIWHRKKDQWILPQEHLYRKPISSDKIVLPKKKNI